MKQNILSSLRNKNKAPNNEKIIKININDITNNNNKIDSNKYNQTDNNDAISLDRTNKIKNIEVKTSHKRLKFRKSPDKQYQIKYHNFNNKNDVKKKSKITAKKPSFNRENYLKLHFNIDDNN